MVAPPIEHGVTSVLVDYTTTRFVAYDASGKVLAEQRPRKRATLEVTVRREGDRWVAQEVRRL